jgi:3-hydroxybenzoate 6-monooxygenase
VLGAVVARARPWRDDSWASVLDEVARRREPRTSRVQTAARAFGEICHVDGIGAVLRDVLLRSRRGDFFDELDWLYRPSSGAADRMTDSKLAHAATQNEE